MLDIAYVFMLDNNVILVCYVLMKYAFRRFMPVNRIVNNSSQ
jgi:hypothetical protein